MLMRLSLPIKQDTRGVALNNELMLLFRHKGFVSKDFGGLFAAAATKLPAGAAREDLQGSLGLGLGVVAKFRGCTLK